ncbi:hypothetical protein QQ045_020008 [Rhodiola kirilowii]
MYPKVKVQNPVDQEDDFGFSWSEISSPDVYQSDSPKCVIRVPTAQILKHLRHPTPEPIVDHKGNKSEEADISSTIARSISVPRPRAVLSSPDNDDMIGSKNSKRVIQPSPLQNHNIAQNRHVPSCKVIPTQTPTESPISTTRKPTSALKAHTPSSTNSWRIIKGKPKAVRDKTPIKVKQSSIVASSQKAHLKTERPNSGTVRLGTSVVPGQSMSHNRH